MCDQKNATISLIEKQFQLGLDFPGVCGEVAVGGIVGAGAAVGGFATGKGTLVGEVVGGTDVGGV